MTDQPGLPEPDEVALAHSQHLRSIINSRIEAAGGVISFADYMNCALYEPGLGYYMAGAAKFGAEGDFITAPEVSPLFGQSLAVQIGEVLDTVGGSVLELGAGSGKLALSILGAIGMLPAWQIEMASAITFWSLVPSWYKRQRQLLESALSADSVASVEWLDTVPADFQGVVLANEVMDALPVERFRAGTDGVEQMCVNSDLSEEARPATDALIKAVAAIEVDLGHPIATGYTSEVCTLLAPWIHSLAGMLQQGVRTADRLRLSPR